MKTTKRFILGIAALMFALAACTDLTEPEELSREPIPQGMGQVHIQLDQPNARTALPGIKDLYFTLDFTGPKTVPTIILDKALTLTVALESGDWKLMVKGYRDSSSNMDSPMLKGESSITVTAGISSNVVVDLKPDFSSGGTGTLSYNVSFPDTVSQAFLVLYPTGKKIDILGSPTGTTTKTTTGTEALPAGSYQAFIDLYDNTNNTAAVWTGVVHIYDGSDTLLKQKFEDTNFAVPKIVGASEKTLAGKLDAALACDSGSYDIILDGTETVGPLPPFNVTGGKDITLTIKVNGQTTIGLDPNGDNGSLLTLGAEPGSSLTLILEDLTLKGKDGNNAPVVKVNSGATLELEEGFLLTGNSSSTDGGGVVVSGGTVTMSGGKINGNQTSDSKNGGGVVVESGEFTMTGGEISGNIASGGSAHGGGVYVASGGKFTLSGEGKVTGNSTPNSGDGGDKGGGGVFIAGGGTFTMTGGEVSNNKSGYDGGGVFVRGNFNMSGGEISGNQASYGGGVYIRGGTFKMTGGVIYGSEAENGSKANKASSAAVYGGTSPGSTSTTIDKRQVTP